MLFLHDYIGGIEIAGLIIACILTILLYIFIIPKKRDGKFKKKGGQFLHNYFNLKRLYFEEVLKFTYVLATMAAVCIGFLLLFGYEEHYSHYRQSVWNPTGTVTQWDAENRDFIEVPDGYYSYEYVTNVTKSSTFLVGFSILLCGPIAIRLIYEISMLFIILVRNVMEINNKLRMPETAPKTEEAAPVLVDVKHPKCNAQPELNVWLCSCGNREVPEAKFCSRCGQRNPNK